MDTFEEKLLHAHYETLALQEKKRYMRSYRVLIVGTTVLCLSMILFTVIQKIQGDKRLAEFEQKMEVAEVNLKTAEARQKAAEGRVELLQYELEACQSRIK